MICKSINKNTYFIISSAALALAYKSKLVPYIIQNSVQQQRALAYKSNRMPYEGVLNGTGNSEIHVVDLRSDTISRPTKEMKEAMVSAEVGDDVYGEDPTVRKLEEKAAEMLGKEAALFVPSGTMGNLIAIMVHCNQRGSEIIVGDNSHIFRFEQAGAAQIAGVQLVILKNYDDGTFSLDELEEKIRVDPDCHEPVTSLISVENTQNMCGGKVLPLPWLDKLAEISKKYNVPLHMDGARLMSAAVYQKTTVSRIVRDFSSVNICLSKNLGCPVGSLLIGEKSFIQRALRMRKALGGGMRQSGILAAAGIVALDKMITRLQEDHDHILQIAKAIDSIKSKSFKVDLKAVQTNILMVYLDKTKLVASQVIERLGKVLNNDPVKVSVRCGSRDDGCVRFVTYWEITDDDTKAAIEKIVYVIKEFDAKFNC